MAKLEIPSIVVHNGSSSVPGSPTLERANHSPRPLSKQKSDLEDGEESQDSVASSIHSNATTKSVPKEPEEPTTTNGNSNTSSNSSGSGSGSGSGSVSGPSPVSGPGPGRGPGGTAGSDNQRINRINYHNNNNNNKETDSERPPNLTRSRSNARMKMLLRSHAMREETSPPRDPDAPHRDRVDNGHVAAGGDATTNSNSNSSNGGAAPTPAPTPAANNNSNHTHCNNVNNNHSSTLSVSRSNSRHKLRHQSSSQGSQESWSHSPSLSRDNSTEQVYTDSSGVDLQSFIAETINQNAKNRMLMLKIEQELLMFIKDTKMAHFRFPSMSSYQRMLVHRSAAYFGLDHNLDQSGNSVVVNRNKATRIPELRFRDFMRDDVSFPEEPRKSILKRDSSSFEDGCHYKSLDERHLSLESRRSKSFEEREEEYEKARRRIFSPGEEGGFHNPDCNDGSQRSSQEELGWPGEVQPWSSAESDSGRPLRSSERNRLLKVESFEGRDTLKANSLRLAVSKSYSFGGYTGGLQRGDSSNSSQSGGSRVLTKQDSGSSMSSRLSPSSSGYKSQSQRSDATLSATPSPTATPVSQSGQNGQISSPSALSPEPSQPVMWAVTKMDAVPLGSVLINPQTGQPFVNADGSVYRYDPDKPYKAQSTVSTECQTDQPAGGAAGAPTSKAESCSSEKSSGVAAGSDSSTCSEKQETPSKSTPSDASQSTSLAVPNGEPSGEPSSSSGRHVTNTATSPLTLPNLNRSSTPYQPPYSSSGQPSQANHPIQMVPLIGPVPAANGGVYPTAPNGVSHPYGTYNTSVPGYLPAGSSEAASYMNGSYPVPYLGTQPVGHVGGYTMNMDPSTGAYLAPGPAGTCCPQGPYMCSYPTPVLTAPSTAHPSYDHRQVDQNGVSVPELSNYFMGMGLSTAGSSPTDQRAGGDSSQQAQQQQAAVANTVATPPQQQQAGVVPVAMPGPVSGPGPGPAPAAHQGTTYYWPHQPSSHVQGYPPMMSVFYIPPNNSTPPQSSAPSTPAAPTGSATSNTSTRNSGSGNLSTSSSNTARCVAASYATGAALFQPPTYSMAMTTPLQMPTGQDRNMNGYPVPTYSTPNGDCLPLPTPQQARQMMYTPSSMHSGSVGNQGFQPALYTTAGTPATPTASLPQGGAMSYYQGGPAGPADAPPMQQGPPLLPLGPYGPQQVYPTATPPLTPNSSLAGQGMCTMTHPYLYGGGMLGYGMYGSAQQACAGASAPQGGPGRPTGPSTPPMYPAGPSTPAHMVPAHRGMVRSNLVRCPTPHHPGMSGVRSSPPPRHSGSGPNKNNFSRSLSGGPNGRDRANQHDFTTPDKAIPNVVSTMCFPQAIPFQAYNLPRYLSAGEVRLMSDQAARYRFTLPTTYRPQARPLPQAYFQRSQSQSSGSDLSSTMTRGPKGRKAT